MFVRLFIFLFLANFSFAQYHLDVENGRLVDRDTRQTVKIVESNSPENRLLWLDRSELDILHQAGVNTIYASLHNEDGNPNLGPWIDYNNPSAGFDENKIAQWREYFEYWISLGDFNDVQNRKYIHLLLSEQENHFRLTEEQHDQFLIRMTSAFSDLPVIWDREEYPRSQTARLIVWNAKLRQLDPNNIIAIHNEPGQEPWKDLLGHDLDLVSMQSPLNQVAWRMRDAFNFGRGQWAVYASEIMPFNIGFQPGDLDLALNWYLQASEISSGAGFYYGLLDQTQTNQEPYKTMYQWITFPHYTTVINNINEMFWIQSSKIDPFLRPIFPDPLILQATEDQTFGFWESRFWIRPLPVGYYLITIRQEGEGVMRFRIFPQDFARVDVVVLNNIVNETTLVYYSDGIKPWKMAVDVLGFDNALPSFVSFNEFAEFRFLGTDL